MFVVVLRCSYDGVVTVNLIICLHLRLSCCSFPLTHDCTAGLSKTIAKAGSFIEIINPNAQANVSQETKNYFVRFL